MIAESWQSDCELVHTRALQLATRERHAARTNLAVQAIAALGQVGVELLGFGPQAVRHIWEAARLGLGETDVQKMEFPALSLQDAIQLFTESAYGERLTFQHA